MVEDVLLQSTFPALLHAGRPSDFPCLSGGQHRPTDRAMAASSARMSSSEQDAEEDARSTDEEDRLLTKRCIKRKWKNTSLKNTCLRVKRLPSIRMVDREHQRRDQSRLSQSISNSLPGRCARRAGSKTRIPDSDVFFSGNHSCLTTVYASHVAFRLQEDPTSDCSKEQKTDISWRCGHVHPCSCLRIRKPATANLRQRLAALLIGLTLPEVRLGGRRQRHDLLLLLSTTLHEVRLDCHRDNCLLLRCVEWRMVGLPLLFVRFLGVGEISGHFILQLLQYQWSRRRLFDFPSHRQIQSTLGAADYPEKPFSRVCDIQGRRGNTIWLPFRRSWLLLSFVRAGLKFSPR